MENQTTVKPLRGIPQAAKMFNLSECFLRKHIREGNLPYLKVGNRFKVYEDDVQNLINSLKYQK